MMKMRRTESMEIRDEREHRGNQSSQEPDVHL